MANMIPISTVTVGSGGAANIEFANIPQTYTDLLVKISVRSSASVDSFDVNISLNSSTSSFSWRVLQGNGSSASSASSTGNRLIIAGGANNTSNTFSSADIYIPNYTGSTNKSISADGVYENNATLAYTELGSILWSNTAPITALSLISSNGNFVQYSSATLYGIRKY